MYLYILLLIVSCYAATIEDNKMMNSTNSSCAQKDAFFPVPGKCDYFIECRQFQPYERMCPDGLLFNPEIHWPDYPCSYPFEVSCQGRGAVQPADPTENCPHQYGYYPSPAAPNDCGSFRMCVAGIDMGMLCPVGLAFNERVGRCDWPDQVPGCNAESFLGFTCPQIIPGPDGQIITNFKYDRSCYAFFSCETGKPRLLSCDEGLAFNEITGSCVEASLVKC